MQTLKFYIILIVDPSSWFKDEIYDLWMILSHRTCELLALILMLKPKPLILFTVEYYFGFNYMHYFRRNGEGLQELSTSRFHSGSSEILNSQDEAWETDQIKIELLL